MADIALRPATPDDDDFLFWLYAQECALTRRELLSETAKPRGARSSNEPRVMLVRSSTTNPADLLASAFFQDGDGSGGYGKMIACSEWPIALRMASSASAIGGGPQRKITVSGPGGGRCPRRMASVMRPVPCDQPAGGCSNT